MRKNGQVEVWLSDEKIIDASMQTIPLADTVYDSLELGISATSRETLMYLDDMKISSEEF